MSRQALLYLVAVLGFLITAAPVSADEEREAARLRDDLALVTKLKSEGRADMALTLASRLVMVNPGSLRAHVTYQDLRIAKGETRALIRQYAKRVTGADVTADDVFLHARLLTGRSAISGLRRALKIDPNHFPALCAFGARLVDTGELDEAEKVLVAARRVGPDSSIPVNLLGRVAEQRGDSARAARLYAEAADIAPEDPLPVLNLGVLLVGQGRYEEAGVALARAIELDPTDPMPLLVLGMLHAAQGEYGKAIEEYRKAVALETNTVASLNMLGSAYIGLEQFDLARKALTKALDAEPENVATLLNLCYLELRQNKITEAAVWARKARKLDSKSAQASYFSGLCDEFLGRQKAAERYYRRAVDLDGENPDYWRALGTFYSNSTRYRDAIKAYERVVHLTDRSAESVIDLAFACVGKGENKRALELFEEVVQRFPENLTAWMNIGLLCQEKLSDPERAIEAYEQYLAKGGKDERVKTWLAELRRGR